MKVAGSYRLAVRPESIVAQMKRVRPTIGRDLPLFRDARLRPGVLRPLATEAFEDRGDHAHFGLPNCKGRIARRPLGLINERKIRKRQSAAINGPTDRPQPG